MEFKTYTVENKFSFQYPSDWTIKEQENRFDAMDTQLKFGDNLLTLSTSGDYVSGDTTFNDDELIQLMASTITGIHDDGRIFETGTDKYFVNNQTAPYTIGTFSDNVHMLVTAKIDNSTVLIQYFAQQNDFDKSLPQVEKVIQSIKPVNK